MASVTLTSTSATIETEHLILRPPTPNMLDSYVRLYGDPKVMKTLADGVPRTKEFVQKRFDLWSTRWSTGDFYSGLAVIEKETGKHVGHAQLAHGDEPGEAEPSCLTFEEFWNLGYMKEVTSAMLYHWVPRLQMKEALSGHFPLAGKPLTFICATARVDNVASNAILQKIPGLVLCKTEEKYGAQRNHYKMSLDLNNPMIPALKKPLAECSMQEITKLLKG